MLKTQRQSVLNIASFGHSCLFEIWSSIIGFSGKNVLSHPQP